MKKTTVEKKFNEVIIKEETRPNGTIKVSFDYSNCPSQAEQGTAHLTDINYLMETYTPDEFAQYIAMKSHQRQPLPNTDYSLEPSYQDSMNVVYQIRQLHANLPDDVRNYFRSPLDLMKFIDNPKNAEKLIEFGFATKTEIKQVVAALENAVTPPTTPLAPATPEGGNV